MCDGKQMAHVTIIVGMMIKGNENPNVFMTSSEII